MSRRLGFESSRSLGTQHCITVSSPRLVVVTRSPDLLKADSKHRSLSEVKLKHLDIFLLLMLLLLALLVVAVVVLVCVFFFFNFFLVF